MANSPWLKLLFHTPLADIQRKALSLIWWGFFFLSKSMDRVEAKRNLETYRHNIVCLNRMNTTALNSEEKHCYWILLKKFRALEKNLEMQLYEKVKR